MKPANYAPLWVGCYPELAEIFRSHGYALAIHGSLGRDFDLIAVPWIEYPSEPETVIKAVTEQYAFRYHGGHEHKEHGRHAYTLTLSFGECFVDLSFTPRIFGELQ